MIADDMTEDDIAASAETAKRGDTPARLLHEQRRERAFGDAVFPLDEPNPANPKTVLRGDAHAAHEALATAARDLKAAQAAVTVAQVAFKAALERWCKANAVFTVD